MQSKSSSGILIASPILSKRYPKWNCIEYHWIINRWPIVRGKVFPNLAFRLFSCHQEEECPVLAHGQGSRMQLTQGHAWVHAWMDGWNNGWRFGSFYGFMSLPTQEIIQCARGGMWSHVSPRALCLPGGCKWCVAFAVASNPSGPKIIPFWVLSRKTSPRVRDAFFSSKLMSDK